LVKKIGNSELVLHLSEEDIGHSMSPKKKKTIQVNDKGAQIHKFYDVLRVIFPNKAQIQELNLLHSYRLNLIKLFIRYKEKDIFEPRLIREQLKQVNRYLKNKLEGSINYSFHQGQIIKKR